MDKIKKNKKYKVRVVMSRVGYIEVEAEDEEKGNLEAMNHLDSVEWDEETEIEVECFQQK